MLSPRFLHAAVFLLIVFHAFIVEAKSSSTEQHTYSNSYYSVTRPGDRWRFDSMDSSNMTTLRWNRYGDDIVIGIQFHDAINITGRDRKRFSEKFWFGIFQNTMTQPYLDRQFRIVSFKTLNDKTIRIEGVNSDRDYLLVDLHFTKENYYGDYVSVEMILKTNDYLDFRDAFYSVSSSTILY